MDERNGTAVPTSPSIDHTEDENRMANSEASAEVTMAASDGAVVPYKYKAFISYSHADEKWASWLHRALETYKLPRHLVGRETVFGKVPARMSPVFRDREELASATELGDALTHALEQSACLVVICSPRAAASMWTNEEILAYKRMGRADRIFSLVVDGEPCASIRDNTDDPECFPPALLYELDEDGNLTDIVHEPIAADVRPGKDLKTNAKLKLIAGMLGIGFDELKQRDLQRNQRRMMAFVGAAMVGMAITSTLAVTAYLARLEADAQRLRAEAEAETAQQTARFMVDLFEVSDPSESRGNSITAREILDKGADRIESDLADQPAVQARLMDTMGSVYTSLGLYEPAVALLERALVKRRESMQPDSPLVADSLRHLGVVQTRKADFEVAEANLRSAVEIQRHTPTPDAPRLAESLSELADAISKQGRYDEAAPLLAEALTLQRSAFGDVHETVAKTRSRLGLNHFDLGDYESAVRELRGSVVLYDQIYQKPHPDTAEALNDLAWAVSDLGEFNEASTLFARALDMKRALYDPSHPEVAFALNNYGYVLEMQGEYEGAEAAYREAVSLATQRLGDARHPEVLTIATNIAVLQHRRGDVKRAIETLHDVYKGQEDALGEHPDVARTGLTLSFWLIEEGVYGEAETILARARRIQMDAVGPDHPAVAATMTIQANLYLATLRFDEAVETARQARAILTAAVPEGSWRIAAAATVEGAAMTETRNFEAAETLLLGSIDPLEEAPIPGLKDQNRARLNRLYTLWGKTEEAAKYVSAEVRGP